MFFRAISRAGQITNDQFPTNIMTEKVFQAPGWTVCAVALIGGNKKASFTPGSKRDDSCVVLPAFLFAVHRPSTHVAFIAKTFFDSRGSPSSGRPLALKWISDSKG